MMKFLSRVAIAFAMLVLSAGVLLLGYRLVYNDVALGVYRDRLDEVSSDLEGMRREYNRAVRRSAVTELVVDEGSLSVRVRTPAGVLEEIETPFDPSREIFVDFAVVDGRVWMRRIYDEDTKPSEGMVIDPSLGAIDWDAHDGAVGKVIYRTLGEGRWVISVAGDGSLGLRASSLDGPEEIIAGPEVRDFEPVEEAAQERFERIRVDDIWDALFGGGSSE